jgi:hypothetical protein
MFARLGQRSASFAVAPVRRSMATQPFVNSAPRLSVAAVAGGLAAFAVGAVGSTLVHADSSKASDSPAALSPKEFREFPVVSTKKLSADSVQVRLALPSSDHVLGMTTWYRHCIL